MKLALHEAGDGDRTALLVHGVMSSADTWRRVAPLLTARGYRVIMPDLRGHGDSPHADEYTPELLAADLVESVPAGVDVALAHSFGAPVLALALPGLRPARVVYSDPAWRLGARSVDEVREFAQATKSATAESIRRLCPRWLPEDIEAELAGYARWDVRAIEWLQSDRDLIPARAEVPSLVQGAGDHHLVPDELAERLRERGFEVVYVPDTGHCIHRDDVDGFLKSLDGWL
ncbi:alpha/beta hydrolase [Streptomyces sp. NPDC006184]|uniref:alpha/beta fold hydrolase n=1 Tax=Streptomyces sp. NPDC006184 TaxID=3155455 RepID=UPI0033B05E21